MYLSWRYLSTRGGSLIFQKLGYLIPQDHLNNFNKIYCRKKDDDGVDVPSIAGGREKRLRLDVAIDELGVLPRFKSLGNRLAVAGGREKRLRLDVAIDELGVLPRFNSLGDRLGSWGINLGASGDL